MKEHSTTIYMLIWETSQVLRYIRQYRCWESSRNPYCLLWCKGSCLPCLLQRYLKLGHFDSDLGNHMPLLLQVAVAGALCNSTRWNLSAYKATWHWTLWRWPRLGIRLRWQVKSLQVLRSRSMNQPRRLGRNTITTGASLAPSQLSASMLVSSPFLIVDKGLLPRSKFRLLPVLV